MNHLKSQRPTMKRLDEFQRYLQTALEQNPHLEQNPGH